MKLTIISRCFVCMFTVLSFASVSCAEDVVLNASKDNSLINDPDGAFSNGVGPDIFSGRTGQVGPGALRGILAFDIAGTIPSGSAVTDVQLTLVVSKSNDDVARLHSLHAVTQDWGEGTSLAIGGNGTDSTANDATWIHNFFPASNWATPGGDFNSTASATQAVSEVVGSSVTWGSTADLVSDVQGWLDDPSSNYGWVLIGEEAIERSARGFHSRESLLDVPVLSVSFMPVPEPGAATMIILSFLLGLLSARKARG
jgi:hypothetical protein